MPVALPSSDKRGRFAAKRRDGFSFVFSDATFHGVAEKLCFEGHRRAVRAQAEEAKAAVEDAKAQT